MKPASSGWTENLNSISTGSTTAEDILRASDVGQSKTPTLPNCFFALTTTPPVFLTSASSPRPTPCCSLCARKITHDMGRRPAEVIPGDWESARQVGKGLLEVLGEPLDLGRAVDHQRLHFWNNALNWREYRERLRIESRIFFAIPSTTLQICALRKPFSRSAMAHRRGCAGRSSDILFKADGQPSPAQGSSGLVGP